MKYGLATVSTFKNVGNSEELHVITSSELKKLQNVLTEMMVDMDLICRKYGINYSLGGGSCLGAVRHKGFIPWDDDIDVDILRRDVDKFYRAVKKEYGDKYWIHRPEDGKCKGIAFMRVRKKDTVFVTREDTLDNEENGVYLDFFVIENTYNNWFGRRFHGLLSLTAGFMYSCRNFYEMRDLYRRLGGNDEKLNSVVKKKIFIGRILSFARCDSYIHLWNNVNKMCRNDNSRYVTVPVGRKHFFGELRDRNLFEETIDCEFNKYTFRIPKNYDEYLTSMYGDYMKIPKKADREVHVCRELRFGE